jgi:EmrB/QacA subfamily drug resistance transporter
MPDDSAVTAGPAAGNRRWLALAVLCSAVVLVNMDITVLNTALPTLARDLSAGPGQLQWVIDAYSLVFGALLPVSGSLADRVGRKRLFLAGVLVFAAGSAGAALSGSAGTLIMARAGMGAGAALMVPPCLSIITSVFRDPAQRQQAISFWAASSGLGFAAGPVISGLLLAHFWWGSVFLINVPVAAVAIAAAVIAVPESRNPAAAAPDVTGGFLSVCGLGLMLWSVIAAPTYGWSSAAVAGAGGAALAFLAGFTAWEHRSSHPMLPLEFFRRRAFSGAVVALCALNFALIGALFVLTQFLQFNLGYTPAQAGLRMLPVAVTLVAVTPLSPLVIRVAGRKLVTAGGLALICAGLWLMSRATVTWTYPDLLPALLMAGIGAALTWPTASGSVMASVERENAAVAAAANSAFLQVGASLGVAVIGSVLSAGYQDRMSAALNRAAVPAGVRHAAVSSLSSALSAAHQAGGHTGRLVGNAARSAFIGAADTSLFSAALVVLAACALALIVLPARPPGGAEVSRGSRAAAGKTRHPAGAAARDDSGSAARASAQESQ